MIQVTEIKPGTSFRYEGSCYTCISMAHNKTAMRQMIVKAKVKNLFTGSIIELSFSGAGKVELLYLDKQKMQYLYADDISLYFMNMETFDQIMIAKELLTWELNFIVPETIVDVTSIENQIIGVELPSKVILEVTYTEPATKGDTQKMAMKDAELETGYKLKVPIFVNIGDKIIVKTDSGEYDSRA